MKRPNVRKVFALTVLATALIAACSEDAPPPPPAVAEIPMATITGSVEFRERVGLTPSSRLDLQLLDVTRADVAATEIASRSIDNPGQSPIAFTIDYAPADIDERMSYSISAKVFDQEQLILVSDSHNPVLTRGAGQDVTVRAVRVVANKQTMPNARFIGTRWKLVTVQGHTMADVSAGREPDFLAVDNGQIGGFAGCNNFTGAYTFSSERLVIGNLASTMMACPDDNDVEAAYLAVFGEPRRIVIRGQTLSVYSDDGLLATFEADNRR